MSVIIDGTSGVNTPNTFAFKNRLIDGGFIINQRGYVSGTALSSGTYAHDRWKAGSGGCTYTFTQGSLGVPTTITITAGSLQQVIEGCNMPEGGTYVLSWTGTAQARFNGGTYGSSPLAVTGITAGANTTIEFNTGTVGYAQLEVGSQATSFDYRPYTTELQLCQYYCPVWVLPQSATVATGLSYATTAASFSLTNPVTTRVAPTGITVSGNINVTNGAGSQIATTSVSFGTSSVFSTNIGCIVSSGLVAGQAGVLLGGTGGAKIIGNGCEL